jgi:predicted dehydrogenase
MKKIGFIDYYIDEWHANNFPVWIRSSSFKDSFEIGYAWEEKCQGGLPLNEWCEKNQIQASSSLEQLIENSDCLMVLAPSNPEVHERLADLPLKSGKPVYIDKPFTPDFETASRLFQKAKQNDTPLMSSSALRYGKDLQKLYRGPLSKDKANWVSVRGGGGSFWEYSIHQIEMLVMMMGTGAESVKQYVSGVNSLMLVNYADGRKASVNFIPGHPFQISVQYGEEGECKVIDDMGGFFPEFTEAVLSFFDTGKVTIPHNETLEIIALVEAGIKALEQPETSIKV